ncbi:MAG: shikimate kinase, partial [Ktedonobacterales bacterium]
MLFPHGTLWGMNTTHAERIILIGPPGSGKTTVAARVAALLGWSWVDTDGLVKNIDGRDIPTIFARDGEERFRELEASALRTALHNRHVVVATGGGIGERAENLALMREAGWVVSLSVRPETALARMRLDLERHGATPGETRPLLAGDDPLARLYALSERREAWYTQADDVIVTDEWDEM